MKHARADYERFQDPAEIIPTDEPVFLLRAQDETAAKTVRFWAVQQEAGPLRDCALRHVALMEAWPKKKAADGPHPVEPTPAGGRHIATPYELLELLAGISSDPQVEGLSLAQKASTMALLHIAAALQQIALSNGPVNPPSIPEGQRGTGQEHARNPERTVKQWQAWAKDKPNLARTFARILLTSAAMTQDIVQSTSSQQEPS